MLNKLGKRLSNNWVIILLILVYLPGIFLFLILIFRNLNDTIAIQIREYLKVLLWPVVAIIFIFLFKQSIHKFLKNSRLSNVGPVGAAPSMAQETQQQDSGKAIKTEPSGSPEVEKKIEDIESYKQQIAEREEKISQANKSQAELIKELKEIQEMLGRANFELQFERIFKNIYPSQINFLNTLYGQTNKQTPISTAIAQFLSVRQFLTPQWNYRNWLNYLYLNELIQDSPGDTIQLTKKGEAFVTYLTIMNYRKFGYT